MSAPLSKIDKIVMVNTNGGEGGVGASKITSEVTNIIAQVPPVLEAMTGIKLTELMKNVPGLSQPPIEVQPIGNGATPVAVLAITPESLVAVVDAPIAKPDVKEPGGK